MVGVVLSVAQVLLSALLILLLRRARLEARAVADANGKLAVAAFNAITSNDAGDLASRLRWLRREFVWWQGGQHPALVAALHRGSGIYERRGCCVCHRVLEPYEGTRASAKADHLWRHEACAVASLSPAQKWAHHHTEANYGHGVAVEDDLARCVTCGVAVDTSKGMP